MLLRRFQQWLQVERAELATVRTATAKDASTRGIRLQALETRVPEGQRLLEELLRAGSEGGAPEQLEDLRYQWMLYKSTLEDAGHLLTAASPGQPAGIQKAQTARPPRGSFPQRVRCAALPLQLLLLLFVLLLLLLPPAGDEDRSCARANNLERSFRLMLRYSGPPPT